MDLKNDIRIGRTSPIFDGTGTGGKKIVTSLDASLAFANLGEVLEDLVTAVDDGMNFDWWYGRRRLLDQKISPASNLRMDHYRSLSRVARLRNVNRWTDPTRYGGPGAPP